MFVWNKFGQTLSSGSSRISGWAPDACPAIKPVLLPNFALKKPTGREEKGEIGSTNA